ncbi:SLBB domain-containing protein [Persicobacter diffluens]
MRLLFSLVGLFFFMFQIHAQSLEGLDNIDFTGKSVDDLSDAQIMQIQQEMTKRGLGMAEIEMFAQAKGIPQLEVNKLKSRLAEVSTMGASSASGLQSDYMNSQLPEVNTEYSEKEEIPQESIPMSVFGSKLFNAKNLTFEPSIALNPSSDYRLGVGDEVRIDIWGASQQNYKLLVDKTGSINIPNIGPIRVSGMHLKDAQSKILNRLSAIYSGMKGSQPNTFGQVSMGMLQGINVNVIGEVILPGTYTLPSTASLFNALYLSGGPNDIGSFRKVQVIRGGEIAQEIDVYDYLVKGKGNANIQLENDDVIKVPPYQNRVVMAGEFKRTGIFEGKHGESVMDMVDYAGGFTENAYTHRLEIFRKNGREQTVRDVTLDQLATTVIQNGDSILVKPVLERYANRVQITGAVFRPGTYEVEDGLQLSTLIKKAEGLKEDAFLERGYIYRKGEDLSDEVISFSVVDVVLGKEDIVLQREDYVVISSLLEMREELTIDIGGPVMKPGEYTFGEGMKLKDLIVVAGGFKIEASGARVEVARRLRGEDAEKASDKIAEIFVMDISKNLTISEADGEFELKPFDKVFVRKAPGSKVQRTVTVTGEVIYPGNYSLSSEKERISDVMKRAGGFNANAYLEGAMLTRRIIKSEKQLAMQEEMLRRDQSIELTNLEFEVVGIQLEEIMKNPGGKMDIYLEAGDEITIPQKTQTVRISGEVLNPVSTTFEPGKRARYYISQGGGFGLNAKRKKTYVRYPNGTTGVTRSFIFKSYPKVTPGSEVIVPQRPPRAPMTMASWMALASSAAALALTVTSIVNNIK